MEEKRQKKKKKQKRPPNKVTPAMVRRKTRMLTTGKSHHSFRSVASSLEMDKITGRYHIKERGEKRFKEVQRILISKAQQETCRKRCMNLRKTLRSSDVPSILFTDECYFIVGKHFNHQNERCYGKSLASIPDEKKFRDSPKTSLSAMVFGGISRDGRSSLIVLKSGFKLNQETYQEKCLIPLLENFSEGLDADSVILYQDRAPCHAGKKTQSFLEENSPRFIRNADIPSNSPDLNPLDYCVWSLLKEQVKKYGLITSFSCLEKILHKQYRAILQQAILDSVDSWMSRVRKVEQAGGGHIE